MSKLRKRKSLKCRKNRVELMCRNFSTFIQDNIMNTQQLITLGFSEKEAAVYLALNQIGPSPASTLAKITNLKRTSMYDILNSLLKKNLIIAFKQGKYTYYTIDDLNKIYYHQKQKMNMATSVIQQLKESKKNHHNVAINYYLGHEGYTEIYNDILLNMPKETLVWMNVDKFFSKIDSESEDKWVKERIRQKSTARLLIQDSPSAREFQKKDKELYRESRIVPHSFYFNTSCIIYENYVTFFDSTGDMTGIRINNKEFYLMQKQIFEMNWKLFD